MIKEISKKEFEERFPETSTYRLGTTAVYLDDGAVLTDEDWNGEVYTVDNKMYKPVVAWDDEADQGTTIGYEIVY